MKKYTEETEFIYQNNKLGLYRILWILQKFWQFSNFYGEYRAKIYFDSYKKSDKIN